jgi:hypothetical protein
MLQIGKARLEAKDDRVYTKDYILGYVYSIFDLLFVRDGRFVLIYSDIFLMTKAK